MTERDFLAIVVAAFERLTSGDFTARIPRNLKRDLEDGLAFYVEVIAEQLADRERTQRDYESALEQLIEKFIKLASGDFSVRAERSNRGDAFDALAYLLNNVTEEIGDLVAAHDRQTQLVAAVLESMIDGVLMLDPAGRIRGANAAMSRLVAISANVLTGMHVSELMAQSEASLARELSDPSTLEAFVARDTVFVEPDGTTLTLSVNGSPHRDASGALVGVVLVARDERELKRAQAHLQMSDKLAAMGTLAAGVAHEVNNPLAFLTANVDYVIEEVEALEDDAPMTREMRAEILKALRSSRGGAERVRNIVRELSSFARSDPDVVTELDFNALIDSAAGLIENQTRHRARVVKQYGPRTRVLANEGRMVQVFLNLIQNAVHAISHGAADRNEIRLVTGQIGSFAFAEVHDTGSGIAPENLARIFDLFYTTKRTGQGTGLGLSIALRLVEKVGGRIEARSELGKGSVFRVLLPLLLQTPPAGLARPSTPRAPEVVAERVLVVDDEVEVGESVRRILGRDHKVDVATSGSQALTLIAANRYDVILCDLLMPDTTGMDLFAVVSKSRPELARRMVFMTGDAFSADAQEFLKRVPNLRFEKPFEARALRETVALAGAAKGH